MQIEARIVIVSDDFSRELGARAGFSGFDFFGNNLGYTSGSALTNDQAIADFLERANDDDLTDDGVPLRVLGFARRCALVLQREPAGGESGRQHRLHAVGPGLPDRPRALGRAAEGRGEVISTPRVITANQREASIEQGVEIPYQESASSGATTISFKKAVLALKVTPQVTPE